MPKNQTRPRSVFTDEVLAAIPGWVTAGADREEIASTLGTTVSSLAATCSKHGISMRRPPPLARALRDCLSEQQMIALTSAAAARGTTASQLVLRMAATIAEEDLFRAVLTEHNAPEED